MMPDAVNGEVRFGKYLFTTQATFDEIEQFYKSELPRLGYELAMTGVGEGGYGTLSFDKDDQSVVVSLSPYEELDLYLVIISIKERN